MKCKIVKTFSVLYYYEYSACVFLQDLKTPKTGSGTDAGEVTASTWQYFEEMHEVLGSRPSVDPPVVVSSFTEEEPITISMVMF